MGFANHPGHDREPQRTLVTPPVGISSVERTVSRLSGYGGLVAAVGILIWATITLT